MADLHPRWAANDSKRGDCQSPWFDLRITAVIAESRIGTTTYLQWRATPSTGWTSAGCPCSNTRRRHRYPVNTFWLACQLRIDPGARTLAASVDPGGRRRSPPARRWPRGALVHARSSRRSHVQLSSYGGQGAFPGNSMYHATKFDIDRNRWCSHRPPMEQDLGVQSSSSSRTAPSRSPTSG
jgi:hypothetical protein